MTVFGRPFLGGADVSQARMVSEVARQVLAPLAGAPPPDPWSPLTEGGWIGVGVSEDRGGSGGGPLEAVALSEALGETAASVPLLESILAGLVVAETPDSDALLARMGAGEVRATVTPRTLTARRDGAGYALSERSWTSHWADGADLTVAIVRVEDGYRALLLPDGGLSLRRGANIAGEPRERVSLRESILPAAQVRSLSEDISGLRSIVALLCAGRLVGALSTAHRLSVEYARERRQFGRSIGTFQAIAHQLAIQARHVEVAISALQAALEKLGTPHSLEASITARVVAGEAAARVASVSHQVHGAIGVTQEYALHRFTMRLLAWPHEYGSDRHWQRGLGRAVMSSGSSWWDRAAPELA
jgi:acyl-CoA dehydrogenase